MTILCDGLKSKRNSRGLSSPLVVRRRRLILPDYAIGNEESGNVDTGNTPARTK
jgi:hypothetical protein